MSALDSLYFLYGLAGLACAGLFAYLLVALWRAEEF